MNNTDTSKLLNMLNSINEPNKLNEYLNRTESDFKDISFVNYFSKILTQKNITKSELIERSALQKNYAYQILNGTKKPSRDKIIQLSIAGNLNLSETQRALALGNVGILYPKIPRDALIIYAINKRLDIFDTMNLLDDANYENFY